MSGNDKRLWVGVVFAVVGLILVGFALSGGLHIGWVVVGALSLLAGIGLFKWR